MAESFKMWQLLGVLVLLFGVSASRQKTSPLILGEENWEDMLHGEWLVKFYAPWCPACKALGETWEAVASWSEDLEIKVAKVDVTENPALSGRFLVTALPTIYHVKDGEFRQYRGARGENDIVGFVDDRKWQEVEPVPWYTAPTTMHMGALGMFFKLSIGIRDLHNQMTSEFGIPVWGSYCIFAVATIIAGLILGLCIVYLCDVIFPPGPPPPQVRMPGKLQPQPAQDGPHDQAGHEAMEDESDMIEDDREDQELKEEEDNEEKEVGEEKEEDDSQKDSTEEKAELLPSAKEETSGGDVRPSTARKRVQKAD